VRAKCLSSGNDIRLFSETVFSNEIKRTELPYFLETQESLPQNSKQVLTPYNVGRTERGTEFFLTSPQAFKAGDFWNNLELQFTEESFDVLASVEGSTDGIHFSKISDHHRLTAFKGTDAVFRYTQIKLERIRFPILRIRLNDADTALHVEIVNVLSASSSEVAFDSLSLAPTKKMEDTQVHTTAFFFTLPEVRLISELTVRGPSNSDYFREAKLSLTSPLLRNFSFAVGSGLEDSFPLGEIAAKEMWLTVYHQNNSPIEIKEIVLKSPITYLVSRAKSPKNLVLLYGKLNDSGASYDLEHFKDKVGAMAPVFLCGPEVAVTAKSHAANFLDKKIYLWLLLGLMILFLGFFGIKLLKEPKPN
jgi:hypothetical protein